MESLESSWTNQSTRSQLLNFCQLTGLTMLEDEVIKDLSTDQKILMDYMLGISSGKLDEQKAKASICPLNHSRWLTLAIRILALYTRTIEPSKELRILVQSIMANTGFFPRKHQNLFLVPRFCLT